MCRSEDCGCECHRRSIEGHQEGYGHHGHHMGFGFPMMRIEEEVKTLEEVKGTLEKRLEDVNRRIEILKPKT